LHIKKKRGSGCTNLAIIFFHHLYTAILHHLILAAESNPLVKGAITSTLSLSTNHTKSFDLSDLVVTVLMIFARSFTAMQRVLRRCFEFTPRVTTRLLQELNKGNGPRGISQELKTSPPRLTARLLFVDKT
jgi:hypothetical protein